MLQKWLACLGIVSYANLCAISIVYNFRIAQITKQTIFETTNNFRQYNTIGLLFHQDQKKYTGNISQHFTGGLVSFIYNTESNYIRVDGAVSHITSITNHNTTYSGTKIDDLLFTIGHNFLTGNQSKLTLSGLLGIPTHHIDSLKHADFGYGQVGTGIQIDGSYSIDHQGAFLYGGRYIRFFPGNACDTTGKNHIFTIGNTADILFAYKYNWTHHGLEGGYTRRWQFGADIYPDLDAIIQKTNYVRNNFYVVYKYAFSTEHTDQKFLFNIAYGFDEKSKIYGNKYVVTLWGAWNLRF